MSEREATPELPEGTYTLSQLGLELQSSLRQLYPGVWLVGEAQRPSQSGAGHLYLELVEKGRRDDVRARFAAVIFRRDLQRIVRQLKRHDLEIRGGQQLRCYVEIDFYPPRGSLQLVVRDVDAVFALGDLERRRRETLAALERDGLLDRNRALTLSMVPLRIGLVTSRGSAAAEDFLATLRASGLPFVVHLAAVSVQGARAELEVTRAVRRLAAEHEGGRRPLDLLALVRGGGSRSDLAVFDARQVAEAIATAPLPVLTGLGHEIDVSVADRVAHLARKTPTSLAEFLVQRCLVVVQQLETLRRELARSAEAALATARREVRQSEDRLRRCGATLRHRDEELTSLRRRMMRAAERSLAGRSRRLGRVAERMAAPAQRRVRAGGRQLDERGRSLARVALSRLETVGVALEARRRLIRQLDPVNVLARGFSITRDAQGRALRAADGIERGAVLRTELARGALRSIVEQCGSAAGPTETAPEPSQRSLSLVDAAREDSREP
ncbi:MAG: exodeoxyribonuclease VII large subunit [Acidobacteria bacterium]|nr:MAG: exodeoxyribonuclease VII large subunit [Acidobacteriota bacterium]